MLIYAFWGYLNFNSRIIYAIRGYLNFNSRIIYAVRGYFEDANICESMGIYRVYGDISSYHLHILPC